MDYVKILGAVISLGVAYFFYRDVKGKKPLRMGDNRFFIEDKNRIDTTDYYRTWRIIILLIFIAIICICWND